ncbi:MAG: hypothetical protein ACI9JN_001390 [Bacteroidia bacterium]|jgi:hypothetical protein
MFFNLNLLLHTMPVFICWVQNTKFFKHVLRFSLGLVVLMVNMIQVEAQTVSNGNFNNTSSGWGCSPEATHVEKTYGGSSSSNRVAEVDQAAGLCQTISGFTIGYEYELSFRCSRRTNCGPTLQTMDVTVDDGALSTSVSRNGGSFNFSA